MVALEALSTLVVTAKTLYDASQTAKENCEECAAIYRTVVSLDDVIRKSANDYISESTMLRLNKITRMLRGIADMIGSLQKRPWLYRLLHSTRVKGKLRLARQELFDATQEFQIGTSTETLSISHEVRQCLQTLQEASQRDEAVVQNVYFQVLSFSDAAMIEKLGVPESKMQEAILALHKHIPELQEGPEKECCTRSLDALQRRSGELPIPPDKYAISSFEVEINRGKKLGSGGFANVYEGFYKEKVVAVKELHEGTHWAVIQQEVEIWRELDHEHILKFIGACPVAEKPFMVCEMKANGDVLTYLRKNPNASKRKILYEASLGLKYLHEKSVVHSDIKANNILIDERGIACLSDFGLSRIKLQTTTTVGPNSENQKQQGTARWMAPEHLAGGTASKKSDIYSFAMTIYEVFSGRPPFPDLPTNMLFSVVNEHGRRPEWTDDTRRKGLDEPMWNVVIGCWQQNPRERSSATELANQLGHLLTVERTVAPPMATAYSESSVPQYHPGNFLQQTSPTADIPMNQTAPVISVLPRPGGERLQHLPRPQSIAVSPVEDHRVPSNPPLRPWAPPSTMVHAQQRQMTVETLSSHLLFPEAGPNSLPSPAQSSSPEATDFHSDKDMTVPDVSSTVYDELTRTMKSIDYQPKPMASSSLQLQSFDSSTTGCYALPTLGALPRALSPEPLIRFDEVVEKLMTIQQTLEMRPPPSREPQTHTVDARSRTPHRDRRLEAETLPLLTTESNQQPSRGTVLLSTGSRTPTPPLSPDLNDKGKPLSAMTSAGPRLQTSRSYGNRPMGSLPEDDYVIRIVQEDGTASGRERQASTNPSTNTTADSSHNVPTSPHEPYTPVEAFSAQPQIARSPFVGESDAAPRPSYFDARPQTRQDHGATQSYPESSSSSSASSPELGPENLPELSSPIPRSSGVPEEYARRPPSDGRAVEVLSLKSSEAASPVQAQTAKPTSILSAQNVYELTHDGKEKTYSFSRLSVAHEEV